MKYFKLTNIIGSIILYECDDNEEPNFPEKYECTQISKEEYDGIKQELELPDNDDIGIEI